MRGEGFVLLAGVLAATALFWHRAEDRAHGAHSALVFVQVANEGFGSRAECEAYVIEQLRRIQVSTGTPAHGHCTKDIYR